MYIRPVHAELDVHTLEAFVRAHPLGQFTTSIKHPKFDTLQSTHIPFVLDASAPNTPGKLRGHMARANPQAKAIIDAAKEGGEDVLADDVLILFNAPVHHYVPPRFYVETKPDTGKTVPTWNYAAVQVYGRLRPHYANTPETSAFLQKQVEDLSNFHEKENGGEWTVQEAPERYVELLKKGIIGLEIEVKRIEGRFKLSQEDTDGDWKGVVEGFRNLGTEKGKQIAEMIEERGKGRDVCPLHAE